MNVVRQIILLLVGITIVRGADSLNTITTFPDEIALTSGRVLKKVRVIRWEKDRVVVRYAGGADPIPFSLVAEPLRSQLITLRDSAKKAEERARELQQNPSIAKPDELSTYKGQAFITTRGAGNYKLGGMKVYVLPESAWSSMETTMSPIWLPKPLSEITTDAEGNFMFSLPIRTAFVLLAQSQRMIALNNTEYYEWRIRSTDIKAGDLIILGTNNHHDTQRNYRFTDQ